jgi:hypothetical protein
MVLWAIALLAAITLLLAGIIEGWITEETREGKQFEARAQALSGIALAMEPSIGPGDPLLHQHSGNGDEGFDVVLKNEAGLINPNFLLGTAPDKRNLLKKLFNQWGLSIDECDAAADGLYDWQSNTPLRSLHGAKQAEYEAIGRNGFPPGAPFSSPNEMSLVIGFDPVMQHRPNWRTYFTTHYNGKINILHAPKQILVDFLGLTPSQADAWMALRAGKDGVDGTPDDLTLDSIEHAAELIGCRGSERSILLDAFDITGNVRRIESTGYCNGVKKRITVILTGDSTDNAQSHGNLLGWSEQ